MAAGMLMKVLCVVVAFMTVVAPCTKAAGIACPQVWEKMVPCLKYLADGGSVPPDCCKGLKGVNTDSKSPVDKQVTCDCIKKLISDPNVKNPNNPLELPGKCGVTFPYKFSNTTDCSKVK